MGPFYTSNLKCLVSDHHNIVCTASKIILPLTVPKTVYYRSIKKFNADAFIEDLSYIPMQICSILMTLIMYCGHTILC